MYLRTVAKIHRNFAKVIPQLISMLSSQCRLSRFFLTLSRMSLQAPHVVVENEGLNLSVKVLRFSTSTDLGSIFMNSLKRLESEIKNTKRHFEWGKGLMNINLFHKTHTNPTEAASTSSKRAISDNDSESSQSEFVLDLCRFCTFGFPKCSIFRFSEFRSTNSSVCFLLETISCASPFPLLSDNSPLDVTVEFCFCLCIK